MTNKVNAKNTVTIENTEKLKNEGSGVTEIVFILDRSGSMRSLEKDTIGGFNSLIDKQKKEEGKAIVSTVLFDDQIEFLHDRVDLLDIKPLTDKEYYARGCTALLDAIGTTIHHIKKIHKQMEKENRPEKTLFVITTDGQENSSHKYDYEKIRKMTEKQQEKHNWEFLFLGANIDAIQTAGQIGIKPSRAVEYECCEAGVKTNFDVLEKTMGMARACCAPMLAASLDSGAWKEDIENKTSDETPNKKSDKVTVERKHTLAFWKK